MDGIWEVLMDWWEGLRILLLRTWSSNSSSSWWSNRESKSRSEKKRRNERKKNESRSDKRLNWRRNKKRRRRRNSSWTRIKSLSRLNLQFLRRLKKPKNLRPQHLHDQTLVWIQNPIEWSTLRSLFKMKIGMNVKNQMTRMQNLSSERSLQTPLQPLQKK